MFSFFTLKAYLSTDGCHYFLTLFHKLMKRFAKQDYVQSFIKKLFEVLRVLQELKAIHKTFNDLVQIKHECLLRPKLLTLFKSSNQCKLTSIY